MTSLVKKHNLDSTSIARRDGFSLVDDDLRWPRWEACEVSPHLIPIVQGLELAACFGFEFPDSTLLSL